MGGTPSCRPGHLRRIAGTAREDDRPRRVETQSAAQRWSRRNAAALFEVDGEVHDSLAADRELVDREGSKIVAAATTVAVHIEPGIGGIERRLDRVGSRRQPAAGRERGTTGSTTLPDRRQSF
jgi:hypothetical protein